MIRDIKGADFVRAKYRDPKTAKRYEGSRFSTFLGRLIHIREIEEINKTLSFHSGVSLLEIATGPGRISKEIRLDAKVLLIGLDSSIAMLKLAKQNAESKGWCFICGDAMKLPFRDESFDILVTFHFVRHLTTPERAEVLNEFYRVLKK